MALNQPRSIPYAFRVCEFDGWVWLYDDSSRTFIASLTPTIFVEPLYPVPSPPEGIEWTDEQREAAYMDAYDSVPDSDYYEARFIERFSWVAIPLNDDEEAADWSEDGERIAWDSARDSAVSNCRI